MKIVMEIQGGKISLHGRIVKLGLMEKYGTCELKMEGQFSIRTMVIEIQMLVSQPIVVRVFGKDTYLNIILRRYW